MIQKQNQRKKNKIRLGSNENHRPFFYEIDFKIKEGKFCTRLKNGAQKIYHIIYKRSKQIFKKIKETVLLQSQLNEQKLFVPCQLLKGNHSIISSFLQTLKNNKFDSYVSLSLKKLQNKSKLSSKTLHQTLKKENKNAYSTKEQESTINKKNRLNRQQQFNWQYEKLETIEDKKQSNLRQGYSIRTHLQDKKNKQKVKKVHFFSQNNSKDIKNKCKSNRKNCQNKQNEEFQDSQNNEILACIKNTSIQNVYKKNQDCFSGLKVTYTCIQKNNISINNKKSNQKEQLQEDGKNLQYSRVSQVSQTFSSKSIKKEKQKLKDQFLIMSDYLTPRQKK